MSRKSYRQRRAQQIQKMLGVPYTEALKLASAEIEEEQIVRDIKQKQAGSTNKIRPV